MNAPGIFRRVRGVFLSRWSPREILTPIRKTSRQSTTHTGVVGEKDDPETGVRPLVGGNGMDQLTTSFRGLVSEGRGSETFTFGIADCQDGVTGHKTEREAFSTNIWPHLEGGVCRPKMATADDKYGLHRESALPEVTWDTNPPKINFTADDFFDFFSCYKCNEEFADKEIFETHMKDRHSQNYYCRHCQVEFSDQTGLMDHINATHVTWSTTTWEAPDDDLS